MIKQNDNKKLGFSLIEALISMLIISVFFIATSRVITQKQKPEVQENPHGYYECYIMQGQQFQHRAISNAVTGRVQTNHCIFEPPTGVNFINIHYYNGSEYYNSQQLILNEPIDLVGPQGILQEGVFVRNNNNGEAQTEPVATGDTAIRVFQNYIRLVNPSSNLADFWIRQNISPDSALLISW